MCTAEPGHRMATGQQLADVQAKNDGLQEEDDAFQSWVPRSPQYLGHREYPGGHFFIDSHAEAITQEKLRPAARPPPRRS